ncbi:hypothetical protein [Corynebacterium ulcerans]|uniref:Laminin n=2 Tax=Corynebacterium ulcerans TaxID=65058 RepID=A0ABD0BH63_CORUL|nr:hypothetical protein [Corynebacterium ulcerans]AEG84710.1 Laminin subunit beta-4 [Corynebacterium ulcerans BR-AD22]AKN77850.1 Hypothetical protein CulFRC58_1996 [Corynebacterium ulcerans FRC58]MBH5299102.1 hypothetical protein [Corynebacterium ulcerans]MBH5302198.1 hypothetical protein [Corynebacterium ulcerans]MBL4944715.1 hypothetical protein [Corynebacterium ulcerans]
MNRRFISAIAGLSIAASVVAVPQAIAVDAVTPVVQATSNDAKVKELEAEIAKLKEQAKKDAEDTLKLLKDINDQYSDDETESKQKIAELQKQIADLNDKAVKNAEENRLLLKAINDQFGEEEAKLQAVKEKAARLQAELDAARKSDVVEAEKTQQLEKELAEAKAEAADEAARVDRMQERIVEYMGYEKDAADALKNVKAELSALQANHAKDSEVAKQQLDAAKQETEAAKQEAEAAKAELEEVKKELEKAKQQEEAAESQEVTTDVTDEENVAAEGKGDDSKNDDADDDAETDTKESSWGKWVGVAAAVGAALLALGGLVAHFLPNIKDFLSKLKLG